MTSNGGEGGGGGGGVKAAWQTLCLINEHALLQPLC